MTAGVNLRQDDIPGFLAACLAAGVAPSAIPVVYTLHDDSEAIALASMQAAQHAGLNVVLWRFFSPNRNYYDLLPHGASLVGWNEMDDASAWPNLPTWVDPWQKGWRAERPDIKLHYGAPNVDGYLLENTALEAALDVVDRHIGSTFSPPAAVIQGKPVWVTEIDIDPNRYPNALLAPDAYPWGDEATMDVAYDELLACLDRCLAAGVPAFTWGVNPNTPDAAYSPFVIAGIVRLNTKYTQGVPMADEATQDAQIATEMDRETHLAYAAYAMAKMLDKLPTNMIDTVLQTEYREHINALDPANLTF